MIHHTVAQEVGEDMGPMSNVLPFTRAKTPAEVNREVNDALLACASDADLADIVKELGQLTAERRAAFYDTLNEYTRALGEQSRRASRG